MRCPNPECDATIEPGDRFCPLCGTDVSAGVPAPVDDYGGQPTPPLTTPRVSETAVPRRPVVARDEAYPALRSYSALMIRTGAVLKWVFLAVGILYFVHDLRLAVTQGGFSEVLMGLIGLGLWAVLGWLAWLFLAMSGEIVYLILDVAHTFVSNVSRHWGRGDGH